MKKYDTYKDSGIEWIGEIPEHWNSTRLKFLGETLIGIIYSPDNVVNEGEGILVLRSSNIQDGKLAFEDCVYVDKEVQEKHLVKKGDILLCARNGSAHLVGKAAYIEMENVGATFGAFMSIVRSKLDKYLFYFFSSEVFKAQTGLFSTSTINQLTSDTLNNMFISFPRDKQEQSTIANYLDRKTAEIDELIADKKRLLELYEEEKTAIINQAVTKGINPDVKMKDSGIEWLGEIPEHWEVKPLKSIIEKRIDNRGRTPEYGLEGIPMLEVKQISENSKYPVESFEKFVLPNVLINYIREELHEGDILIATVGATAGKCCIVPAKPYYFIAQNVIGFRFYTDNTPMYIYYLIQSDFFKKSLYSINKSNTIDNLKVSVFVNNYVPIPLPKEQLTIAKYLDAECARIDTKKSRTEKLIDLLTEYRTALISEVVTGKIKVGE